MRIQKLDKGISNVVATILLVAVVVALVALLTFLFFNIGGEKSYKSSTGSVELTATNSGIQATVLESGNAKEYIIDGPNAELPMGADTGDTIQANDGTGEYAVIAVMPDGTKQVVQTTQIEEIDSEGYFVVTQYTDDKEAYAEIINTYEGVDEYEIIVNAEDNEDTSTVSTTVNSESNTGLLSYFSDSKQPQPELLKFDIAPGQKLNVGRKNPIFSVAEIAKQPNKSQFSPEQDVAVHKMTNLCKGDEIHLVNSESNTDEKEVLATGEEIQFDSEGCDELRKVAEYEGGKIVGVKLINLWHRSVDYSVFAWNGDVPPPTQPVEKGTVTAKVTVVDTNDDPIENANVQLANRTGSTDGSGEVLFNNLPKEDVTMFATAEKSGFYSNSTPIEITDDITTATSPDFVETVTLKPRDQQTPTQEKSGTVPSEGTTSIDFSSPKSSSTVTGGSGGGSRGGGSGGGSGGSWGGGGSYTPSGGGIYDGSSTESTQTLSSATPTEEDEIYVDIKQPDRQFNTIPIDDRIIPTGSEGKFEVRTSVLATESPDSGSTIEDEVVVTAVSESGANISLSGDNQRKTVELEPNTVSTVSQEFYFPSGQGLADENYTIFVSLDSSSNIKTAGTLEVFDGSKLGTTIDGAEVSPQNPTLDSDTDSVEVDITVDSSNITWNGASEVTLDIFENGQLINRKTIQQSSFSEYTYTRTHENTGYYDYHVGIMESQDVSLADSVLVQGSTPSNIDFDVNLTTSSGNCGAETSVGDQFDCEILVGQDIDLKGEVNVSGTDANELENAEIVWTWGEVPDKQERVYTENTSDNPIEWSKDLSSAYSANNYDDSITGFSSDGLSLKKTDLQYDTSEAYILELRVLGEDSNGNEIGLQDDITLNVAKDPTVTTTKIVDTSVVSGYTNRGTIELESGRESYEETVDLGFYKEKSGGSKKLIRSEDDISVVRSGDTENVTTSFTLSDYQQSDEEDTATVYVGLFEDGVSKTDYYNSIDATSIYFDSVPTPVCTLGNTEDQSSSINSLSGTVKIDSSTIGGAKIKALNKNGRTISTTTTDNSGSYSFNTGSSIYHILVNVNGSTNYNSNPLFASTIKDVNSNTLNIGFDGTNVFEYSVDNSKKSVIYSRSDCGSKLVTNLVQLQSIDNGKSANYTLSNNIDASPTQNWNKGFDPITIKGVLNGNNYTIDGLHIKNNTKNNYPANDSLNLKGTAPILGNQGTIKNIIMKNFDIFVNLDDQYGIGGIVTANEGVMKNTHSISGRIESKSVDDDTDTVGQKGSLVAYNLGTINYSSSKNIVIDSDSDGTTGGLASQNIEGAKISKSYSINSDIKGRPYLVGTIVGLNSGTLNNTYSNNDLYLDDGYYYSAGISSSFSSGVIKNSYTYGRVVGGGDNGVLFEQNNGETFKNTYYNKDTYSPDEPDVTGLTTSEMQGESAKENMNFDFDNTWDTVSGDYPKLSWQK